jgi:cell division protein FtsN
MAEEYLNINPTPPPRREEPDPDFEPPAENRFGGLLKNGLTFLLLLLVVIASFWVSFQLGRRILLPVNKVPGAAKIEAAVPETPDSIKALQRLQAALSGEAQKKTVVKKKAAAKTVQYNRVVVARPVSYRKSKSGRGYFKVQAGWFTDRNMANELAGKVKAAGHGVFIRKVRGGWRVQAGAFRKKSEAEALRQKLAAQGFKPQVLFE